MKKKSYKPETSQELFYHNLTKHFYHCGPVYAIFLFSNIGSPPRMVQTYLMTSMPQLD
uniref:Uncharacterized protein n=1 Tax=Setaria italica TaxID=4555 RepID=K3YBJ8_SETIT